MSGRLIRIESLSSSIRIACPDNASAQALSYIEADPTIVRNHRQFIDLSVRLVDANRYAFGDRPDEDACDVGILVEQANTYARKVLFDEIGQNPILHAGSMIMSGSRIIVIASKGSGKTTLMAKCLAAGIRVEGDEHVIVYDDLTTFARPRTLRIKQTSLELLPELAEAILDRPFLPDWRGVRIYSFAPRTSATDWTIECGAVDAMVFLAPQFSENTSLEPMGTEEAYQLLLENAFLPAMAKGKVVARLHRVVSDTQCWKMRLGELETALIGLRSITG